MNDCVLCGQLITLVVECITLFSSDYCGIHVYPTNADCSISQPTVPDWSWPSNFQNDFETSNHY